MFRLSGRAFQIVIPNFRFPFASRFAWHNFYSATSSFIISMGRYCADLSFLISARLVEYKITTLHKVLTWLLFRFNRVGGTSITILSDYLLKQMTLVTTDCAPLVYSNLVYYPNLFIYFYNSLIIYPTL